MSRLFRLFLLLALLPVSPLAAQQSAGGGSAYAVAGIDVDVTAANPALARMTAYRIAQRKAWPMLWLRVTGREVTTAPRLSDGQLDSIVAGIESQGERFSMTRYIARLGVVFDRSRTAEYLAGSDGALQSPPMLLLPLLSDGAVRRVYDAKTPWLGAWQRFRETVTPVDYVLASGGAGENLLLTGWQATRPDRQSWRNILNRFDAVDVLTAEARLVRQWPGGPVTGLFIARHGPDATELGRVRLQTGDDAGVDAMLDTAVRQIDAIYTAALRDGRLRSETELTAELAPLIGTVDWRAGKRRPGWRGSEQHQCRSRDGDTGCRHCGRTRNRVARHAGGHRGDDHQPFAWRHDTLVVQPYRVTRGAVIRARPARVAVGCRKWPNRAASAS